MDLDLILNSFPKAVISIDTFRGKVAKEAIQAGAAMINDISAFELDKEMINTLSTYKVPYVLMHMQGTPQNMQKNPYYKNVVKAIIQFLDNKISKLKNTSEVLAVCKIPEKSKYMDDQKPLFFLDGINDPGNMGSILRSLDWFGYQQVFCSNHTVDSYNNKVVMASMGSVFRVNAFYLDFKDFKTKFKNHTTYVATMDGETIHSKMLEKKSI